MQVNALQPYVERAKIVLTSVVWANAFWMKVDESLSLDTALDVSPYVVQ